jgi:4-hydroxybenzoyl-CoA reductase subunit beta
MHLPKFDYHAPDALNDAVKIKGDLGAAAPVLAGGTDLIVQLKNRLASPAVVISLKNIKELRGIEETPDAVAIGAGTSLIDIARSDVIQRHFPVLKRAVESIGAVGIQHYRGTIGGNLCLSPRCTLYNQSQLWRSGKGACHRTGGRDCHALEGSESCHAVVSGDTVPVLMALSAQLTVESNAGKRMIPMVEFFTGKGESPFNLLPEEILTGIRLPLPWTSISGSYQRLAMRSAVDYPIGNAAAVAIVENGKVESFRLVLSAVGPAPVVLSEAERMIKGAPPDPEMVRQVADLGFRAAEGRVVENSPAAKDYRIKMAGVMAARATREALGL